MIIPISQVHRHHVSRADLSLAVEMLGYQIGNRTLSDGETFEISITGSEEHPCDLVEISSEDSIFLAQRDARKSLTPMVRGKARSLTNELFIVFRYSDANGYPVFRILTSFYGQKTYKELIQYDEESEFIEAYRFWNTHALVPEKGVNLQVSAEFDSFQDYASFLSIRKFGKNIID